MTMAIIGAGALGCFIGACLARTHQPVVLIDIDAKRIANINAEGLRLETDTGEFQVPIRAALASDLREPFDILIVLTKGLNTDAAIQECLHLIGDTSYLVSFQNGIGNAEIIRNRANVDRIVIGMTTWAADLRGPSHVVSVGRGELRLWRADGQDDPQTRAMAAVLDGAGLNCTADPYVESAIWEKIAFNSALNPIAAVTGRTVGEIGDDPDAAALAREIVGEVLRVASARALRTDHDRVMALLAEAFREHRTHLPSMLRDVLAGRRTEIEFINGAVVAEAERLGVSVPATKVLLRLVRMRETRPDKNCTCVGRIA
jgi:2-dehydropantoate 2-reductase